MTARAPTPDRFYARACYDTLVVQQPHVKTEGMWWSGESFVIVCPNLRDDCADDGQPITAWFGMNKILGAPVSLVPTTPTDAVRVSPRTAEELAEGFGDARTLRDTLAGCAPGSRPPLLAPWVTCRLTPTPPAGRLPAPALCCTGA